MVYVWLFSDFHRYFQMLKSTLITEKENNFSKTNNHDFCSKKSAENLKIRAEALFFIPATKCNCILTTHAFYFSVLQTIPVKSPKQLFSPKVTTNAYFSSLCKSVLVHCQKIFSLLKATMRLFTMSNCYFKSLIGLYYGLVGLCYRSVTAVFQNCYLKRLVHSHLEKLRRKKS